MSRSQVSKKQQYFEKKKNVADVPHLWSDSKPGVDTVGIYVEIMRVRIENASFGYDLNFEIWNSDSFFPVA